MKRTRRAAARCAVAAAALLLALTAAGCDGGGNGEENGEPGDGEAAANAIAAAATKTIEAGTARVFYDALVDGPQGSFQYTAEGEVDYGTFRSRLVYDVAGVPQAGSPQAVVRVDGPVVYVRFPDGSSNFELPDGKEWVRIPPPEEGGSAQPEPLPPELDAVRQDPAQFLRYLPSGATDVQKEQGTEEVRGVTTSIYTAVIDIDRVVAEGLEDLGANEEQRAGARRIAEGVKAQLDGVPIPVTVNIDEEGFVRRLLLTFNRQVGPRGQFASALTTTEYDDFGTAVEVEPPPPGRVVDAAEIG